MNVYKHWYRLTCVIGMILIAQGEVVGVNLERFKKYERELCK
jgi:hypothetical protein